MLTPLDKRQCGDCKACCIDLKIELPELRKEAGIPCRHLNGQGCGIYGERPELCRHFLCGWRLEDELSDDWRPDRAGVLIMQKAKEQLPPPWAAAPYGALLVVTGGEAALRRAALADYAARLIARGIPIYMGVDPTVILVNDHLKGTEDVHALRQCLLELYAMLEGPRWGLLRKIAFLYRLQLDRARHRLLKPEK